MVEPLELPMGGSLFQNWLIVDKNKAIEKLERLRGQISPLSEAGFTHTREFREWKFKVETAIKRIFPGDKEKLQHFRNVRFKPGLDFGSPQHARLRAISAGFRAMDALLAAMIDEIKEYWDDDDGPKVSAEKTVEMILPEQKAKDPKNVFVVHGRNLMLRNSMFAFLRAIGLTPIEWSQARALTKNPTPYIGQILDKAFCEAQAVVVLMTPDDEARLKKELQKQGDAVHETELTGQARPNVLFEAGMAMGRYPTRTILVEIGPLRPFSDISGLHVVEFDGSSTQRQELAHRLRDAGCPIDLSGTDWHNAGSFEQKPSHSDVKTAEWRNGFGEIVGHLKTEMIRGEIPNDWLPTFERSIPILNRVVRKMPDGIIQERRTEITALVGKLCEMSAGDGGQAVYGKQEVIEILGRLEDLTDDT